MKPKAVMALSLRLMGIWLLCQSLIGIYAIWVNVAAIPENLELARRQFYASSDVRKEIAKASQELLQPFLGMILLFGAKRISTFFYGPMSDSCQECGYSRRGLQKDSRCPECGSPPEVSN